MISRRYAHLRAVALFLLGWLPLSVQAAVVYVNQNAPGGTNNGTSWGTAFLTIQAGVDAAQPGDEVWVAKGTYAEHVQVASTVALYGGFAGTETALGQRNVNASVTTITWDAAPAVDCSGAKAVVSGFRIRSTNCGVLARNAPEIVLTVTDCDIGGGGGGIVVDGLSAVIARNTIEGVDVGVRAEVADIVITGNTIGGAGVGLLVESATGVVSTAAIVGNTLTGNVDGLSLSIRLATVANNIIAFNSGYGIGALSAGGLYLSCNDVFGNGRANYSGLPDMTGVNGNLSADPLLSGIYHDIHIQPASPCRNAGNDAFATTALDVDRQPRIQGASVDIGADESDGATYTVPSRTWYVRATGNDANTGTSWAAARATLAGASRVARGGDEVWVAEGTYTETLIPPAGVSFYGGFAGSETSLGQRSVSSHPTVIQGPAADRTVVDVSGAGVRVDGFTIRDGREGVRTFGDLVVANCRVIVNTVGIRVNYGTATLTGNFIADCRTDAVNIQNAVVTMTGNVVDWNSKNGVYARPGARLTLHRNVIQRNNEHGLLLDGDARADVRSNVIMLNTIAAVWLNVGSRVDLHSNTIVDGFSGVGVHIDDATAHLSNNIIAFNPDHGMRINGAFSVVTMAANDFYGNNPDYGNVPADLQQNNVSVDPFFGDRANYNYRLRSGSPLIDVGDDSAVAAGDLDLDGNPRIMGPHVDIGAYEFVQGSFATMADVLSALKITGGLQTAAPSNLARLNVVEPGLAVISLPDAARLARKVAGLEPNP